MRKVGISAFALFMAIIATGCVIAIGTGRHPRTTPCGANLVEIEGKTYVVDVQAGTVRPAGERTLDGEETADD